MTTPKLDQARIWADELTRLEGLRPGPRAAIEVIQSLPDHWIDVKEVREVVNSQLSNYVQGTVGHSVAEDFACKLQSLLTPPLPTLEDMTAEEREASQWMQAQVFATSRTPGIITHIDEYARSAIILFTDGMAKNVPWKQITPRPDLPKLEWPWDGVVDAEIVDDESVMLPRPEDVPAEEPWIVLCGGYEWVGVRVSGLDEHVPWTIIRMSGLGYRDVSDSDITLVSRLVPEVKP